MPSGSAASNPTHRFSAEEFFMPRRPIRSLASPAPDSPESNRGPQQMYGCLLPLVPLIVDGDRTRTSIGCASLSGYVMEPTRAEFRLCLKPRSAHTLLTCSYPVLPRVSSRCWKFSILLFVPPPLALRLLDANMRNHCLFCLPWSLSSF